VSGLCAIIVTKTESALTVQAMSPEATEFDIGLGEAGVSPQEPCTEYGLGENIEYGIRNNFSVDAQLARAVRDTPDAVKWLAGERLQ